MKKRILTPIFLLSSLFMVGSVVSCNNNSSQQRAPMALEGKGAPSNSLGQDGDTYTDTDTGIEYTKANGTWVVNHKSEELSGEGEPDASLGQNGDTYINNINGAEYVKQNGEWVQTKKGDTTYVVSFNLNGGKLANGQTSIPDQIVREGRWVTEPSASPVKDHCSFLGWYADGGDTKWAFKGTQVYGDVELVAKYSVNEEDKITYTVDPNNGEARYTVETFVGDYSYPSAPYKPGFDFTGWMINSTGEMYNGNVTAAMNGETITAQWEKAAFGVSYRVESNGEVTITGVLNINAVSITVPNTIGGRKVTKIAKTAFNSRIYITTIYIPENVKLIEEGAFCGTRALKTIMVDSANTNYCSDGGILYSKDKTTLVCYPTKTGTATEVNNSFSVPKSVTRIAAYAFYDSKDMGITTITFNEGLVEIGDYAFWMNETITSLTFPSTLRRIGKSAFVGSTYTQDGDDYASPQGVLQTVKFNDGLEEIGDGAFANQYFKDTFQLPDSVKVIAPYAFANCTAITKLIVPAHTETFAPNAFNGCTGILEIDVAAGCTNYVAVDGILYTSDMKTLVLCPSGRVDQVNVPEGVTAIGDYAFYMCDELQDYSFPSTLKTIGVQALSQTYHLNSFTIPDSVTSIGMECFMDSGVKSVTIGSGLTEIPEAAFYATSITSITIPGNVKSIGYEAFATGKLSSAILEEGVETIEECAFMNTSLSTITLPDSLKEIRDSAFASASVKTLYIGKNLESIGSSICYNANSGSTSLESLTVSSENNNFVYQNSMLFSKDKETLYFATNQIGSTVIVPEGVKKIGDYAFSRLTSITNYSLPSTLVELGDGSFTHCKASALTLPSSVKKIGEGAFYFAYTKTVTLNEGLEEIGAYAFRMSDITSLSIPNSVKKIGEYAFYQAMSLTSEISLGTGVEEIGEGAFMNSKISGTLSIPASVTFIGRGAFTASISTYGPSIEAITVDSANANYASVGALLTNKDKNTVYAFASAQETIIVPEGITTIADYGMAAGGNSLSGVKTKSISLPSTLTYIGEAGLYGQQKVASISVPATVSYVGDYAFAYWGSSQAISFKCSRDYALENFGMYFLSGCSATVSYVDGE